MILLLSSQREAAGPVGKYGTHDDGHQRDSAVKAEKNYIFVENCSFPGTTNERII